MPWQRYVVNRALEVDPTTGRLAYREIGLTVPRQSGKSTLILMLSLHRAFETGVFGGHQRMVYAAQTGKDARKKWEQDYIEALDASPRLHGKYKVTRQSGHEAIIFPQTRSRFGLASNTKKSGHGPTLDLAFADEAFAQVDDRLEQAFKPAMVTRPQPQFWVVSTAGDMDSTFLRRKVDRGREVVARGADKGIAYFEWSAPDDADPTDPATWWDCMPALGHTVTQETIQAELEGMELDEFRRAYLNQWVAKGDGGLIDMHVWAEGLDSTSKIVGRPVFALDMPLDRSGATIGAAGFRADGQIHVEVVEQRRGTEWIIPALIDLAHKQDAPVVIDSYSPAATLLPELKVPGVRVRIIEANTRDIVAASGQIYDAIFERRIKHGPQPELDDAVRGAGRRSVGDGWAFGRRHSTSDISPLVAVTLAAWGLAGNGPTVYEDRGALFI